jgi:hypothetical protein
VKQHLERQSGVQKAEVSLRDGTVEITPKEDGQIDPPQLLKAVHDSGVTAAQLDIVARGKIVKDPSGNLSLSVNPKQSFPLAPNELARDLEPLANSQTMVTVRGQLYKKPPGQKKPKIDATVPLKLWALEIQQKE